MNPNFVIEPTHVIQRQLWEISGTGPKSYVKGVGDPIQFPGTQYPSCVPGGFLSVSGTYFVLAQPTVAGNIRSGPWYLRWYFAGGTEGVDGVVIATAGSGQTNGTYTANASGGGGTGAQIQYTIAGGLLTAVTVLNPGKNYTSAPTFTIAAGGTPGTVTASIGSTFGTEVSSGVDLSAESIQLFVIGGEM